MKSHTDASARDGGNATASKGAAGGPAKAEAPKIKGKREQPPKPDYHVACPRCKSNETKFCYYNNYNIKQPRFYCRDCCRYWTEGGMLRNVRVGSGRRKTKKTKEKEAAAAAAAQAAAQNGDTNKTDATNADGKRPRAAATDKGTSRRSKVACTTHKRDGSSDGSATEAEQGDGGNFGYGRRGSDSARWHTNGSNAGSDTAVRGRSPTDDQGSAEGSQQPAAPVGWGVDPAVASYMSTGLLPTGDENVQAQAAAAASAAIMSAATRWGMQFWNKSVFPYGGIPNSSSGTFPGVPNVGTHVTPSTPVSQAALKRDALTHPTPLHPTAAAAAAAYNTPSHPSSQGVQYSSLFQNPWAQFSERNKEFHSNPAMFQAMQQQMFNQQMAAHFIQMQHLHGAMHAHPHGFGATAGVAQPTAATPKDKEIKTEAPSSEPENPKK